MKADLSVIVVNHNKKHSEIEECFKSIKEQTVAPKEIIFVDDHSSDPRAHAMAISILLPVNVGVAKARNVGVRMSSRKLILFVDADDRLAPDFIEQCGKKIVNADIVYPNLLLFGDIEYPVLSESPSKLKPQHLVNKKNQIPVTSMMFREVYESLGGFRELPVFEDWDFWIRAMCNGYTFARANTLLHYRQSTNSRNHQSIELRTKIYNQITAPYEVREGKLWERKDSN
jgi:glycosyltransferase involved in cell wall biosynthesis